MMGDGVYIGDGRCVRETDKAILVDLEVEGEVWLPKKAIHDDSEVWQAGHHGEVWIKRWLADKRGWM